MGDCRLCLALLLAFGGCGNDAIAPTVGEAADEPAGGQTEESGSDEALDETGDEGVGFIPIVDAGGSFLCDPYLQDCPRGKKCTGIADDGGNSLNATNCVDIVDDPAYPGEPCESISYVDGLDTCAHGSFCWDPDPETMVGMCVAYCLGSPGNPYCDDPDARCVGKQFQVCLPECPPLAQDCPVGCGCYQNGEGFTCLPDASGPDDGVAGDPCEFLNACDPGLMCINAASVDDCMGSLGCCSPYCDLTAADLCDNPAHQCFPWFDPMATPAGYENVGVCALPE